MNLIQAIPPWLQDALVVCLGASIGSFLGVVSDRLPEGLSIITPPSYCFRCGHRIIWYDNIPILSFFARAGRCRHCGGRYGPDHLFIELFTAGATWLLWRHFGPHWVLLPALVFAWSLIPIAVIDARTQYIPDALSLPGLAAGLGLSFLPGGVAPKDAFTAAIAGGVGLWVIAFAYEKLRGREGMGGGDLKLLAMMGAFLGLKPMVLALFLGSVAGTLIGGGHLLLARKGGEVPIPFGPFLAAGGFLALIGAGPITHVYMKLIGKVIGG